MNARRDEHAVLLVMPYGVGSASTWAAEFHVAMALQRKIENGKCKISEPERSRLTNDASKIRLGESKRL